MSEEKKAAGAPTPADTSKESKSVEKSAAEIKLEKELEAAKAVISAQNAEMTKLKEQVKSRHKVLNVDGQLYACLAKGNIHVGGKIIKAEELIAEMEIVKELIASGSGLFKKVKEAAKPKKGGKK
jgi:hypothetical protein